MPIPIMSEAMHRHNLMDHLPSTRELNSSDLLETRYPTQNLFMIRLRRYETVTK